MTEHNYKMDNTKLFLICCVVLGHVANKTAGSNYLVASARFWIYLFHMPAFVFVSGLYSKKTVNESKWGKAVPYIFLYVFMKMLAFVVSIILHGIEGSSVSLLSENGVAWYAMAMFWWYAITILIKDVNPKYVLGITVFLSVCSGYTAEIGSFLVLQRTLVFYPFFYLGYLIDPDKLCEKLNDIRIKIASGVLLVSCFIIVYIKLNEISFWRSLFRGRYTYAEITDQFNVAYGAGWRIIGYIISAIIVLAVISIMPSKKIPFVSDLGQRTLSIYALHNSCMNLSVGKIDFLRYWLLNGHVATNSVIFMIILVIITGLPFWNTLLKKIMVVPAREKIQ